MLPCTILSLCATNQSVRPRLAIASNATRQPFVKTDDLWYLKTHTAEIGLGKSGQKFKLCKHGRISTRKPFSYEIGVRNPKLIYKFLHVRERNKENLFATTLIPV